MTFIYKCRLCDERVLATYEDMPLSEGLTDVMMFMGDGKAINPLIGLHKHEDGTIGITDLKGMEK